MPFRMIRNDITKVRAAAIVNTANPEVAIGGGVDRAIFEAAGREKLLEERRKIGFLEVGEVALTKAFRLNAKYIIHVSGPVWLGGKKKEEETLKLCYERALFLAKERGCESIAFPLLSTGSYGFPKEIGLQIAVNVFTEFLKENEMEITLVVFGREATRISGALVDEVESFVDENYEKQALQREYRGRNLFPGASMGACFSESKICSGKKDDFFEAEPSDVEEEEDFFEAEPSDEKEEEDFFEAEYSDVEEGDDFFEAEPSDLEECEVASFMSAPSLDTLLQKMEADSFESHLQRLMNKKGLKNSEVYAAANISKQYFSKLLKGKVKPSKEKVLALALGLRLNKDEMIDFLRVAGYALSPISKTDLIVEYFISREDYNVIKLDIVLFDYGLEPLSSF